MRKMLDAYSAWTKAIRCKAQIELDLSRDFIPSEVKIEALNVSSAIEKYAEKLRDLFDKEQDDVERRIKNGGIVI